MRQTALNGTPTEKTISSGRQRVNGKGKYDHLVHASPGALGSETPEMAWRVDDFPELCEPLTPMMGRSRSESSLFYSQSDEL